MPNDCKDNQENGLDVIMPKYDWENRKYDDGTYTFLWSMPRLDKRKDIYRCVLRGDCLSVKDRQVELLSRVNNTQMQNTIVVLLKKFLRQSLQQRSKEQHIA